MPQHTPRIEDRTKVMMRAQLRGAGAAGDACILDISSRGLAASTENPPSRGEYVELVVGEKSLVGQVKWSSARRFGLAFRDRISVIALISGENGPVGLKYRQASRASAARPRDAEAGKARSFQFLIFVLAGAAATLYIADFVGSALKPLSTLEHALAHDGGVRNSVRAQ